MIKVAIVGCNGKMGGFVARSVEESAVCETLFGVDAFGTSRYDFPVYKSFDEAADKPDVIVDFSNPAALDGMLGYALQNAVPCVICTTGYSAEQVAQIKKASEQIAVFYSGNMSLGINLLTALAKQAKKRSKNEIGIHSVRGGTIVGEHEVIFAGHDEVVTLTHQAQSKEVFAAGAVNAAAFLAQQPAGLYDMTSLLADKFE